MKKGKIMSMNNVLKTVAVSLFVLSNVCCEGMAGRAEEVRRQSYVHYCMYRNDGNAARIASLPNNQEALAAFLNMMNVQAGTLPLTFRDNLCLRGNIVQLWQNSCANLATAMINNGQRQIETCRDREIYYGTNLMAQVRTRQIQTSNMITVWRAELEAQGVPQAQVTQILGREYRAWLAQRAEQAEQQRAQANLHTPLVPVASLSWWGQRFANFATCISNFWTTICNFFR
jgi:hypothetical protein